MSMGIVSNDEFERELLRRGKKDTSENTVTATVKDITRGRGKGSTEVPEALRKVIGDTAITESARDVSEAFGISESSISAYKNGATSTASYHSPDKSLLEHIEGKKERISKKARSRLLMALNCITSEKLADAPLKIASSVARDMSCIVKDMESKNDSGGNNLNAQFVFFAPRLRAESEYEIISARE